MSIQIFASSPPGFPAARVVRAAHYAGATGIAALEYAPDDRRRHVLDALMRSDVAFAASAIAMDGRMRDLLTPAIGRGLEGVVVPGARGAGLRGDIDWIVRAGLRAYVEVTSLAQALAAADAGATHLIVKGNESGGRVGEETTFILLQAVVPRVGLPVIARGGIGLHSAAGCLAAGAAGVVLDWQLALCEEAELPERVAAAVAAMDGSETAILGQDCGIRYRVYARPGESAYADLRSREAREALGPNSPAAELDAWTASVEEAAGAGRLRLIGQDACFARDLATRFRTVAGVCDAIRREGLRQCRVAAAFDPLGENSALARSHGTRFPIVQGPMTRVSDRPAFARAVADGGGLPFLALALMRQAEVASLLDATRTLVGDKPWGVGILGFVPEALRSEQMAEVRRCAPPFAIIAGGRPDQARELDAAGTRCYLHVPSPDLLRTFCQGGARRFVFEGRECGGHVGPRTSLVLWESMVRVILTHLDATGDRADEFHVLFAGGVHDARSAAAVSALAAPLVERGVRIGALVGTGYLFTREAVESGAIQEGFQHEAIACAGTVLLESGVGHATRCADTAFGRDFAAEKRRLAQRGATKEQIRDGLEALNLGRLRIAAKGIARGTPDADGRPTYIDVGDAEQRRQGMYMIGQVAALRGGVCTIDALHRDVAQGAALVRARLAETTGDGPRHAPSDIAIVGLSCALPKAGDIDRFWHNVLTKANAIGEIPKDRWNPDLYFDADRRARDRIYSRWGGFLEAVDFDPVRYGMPPNSVPSVDPLQLLTLEFSRRALEDARYTDRPFDREHTSVVVGTGGGVGELGLGYGFRSQIPHYVSQAGRPAEEAEALIEDLSGTLPEWTEDSFAGLLLNVAAGRVANRFDLGGTNYVVDAACATSLAAVRLAALELSAGRSSMVIAAGADTMQTPFGYLCFSKTQALSPTGQCRTFDESADGIVISEGIAVAVLKRLDDAIRHGDRIYAVVKGIGASSDGKDKGLTAPRPIGQIRALGRAYEDARIAPATVGLIEAHGTGTVVGDRTEIESLTSFFASHGAGAQSCALGSVKSMIGHTKCTAGFAGLLKAALALHYQVLPPTIGVTRPNTRAKLSESPFYLNTEPRPWLARVDGEPRRAGVSAFGFGGTNFHVVLEEYADETAPPSPALRDWPAELFVWRGASAADLAADVQAFAASLGDNHRARLCDLAAAVCWERGNKAGEACLAIVADSTADLAGKLEIATRALASGTDLRDPRGVYLRRAPGAPGKIAFVFPGQGSQRTNMLGDLLLASPSFRPIFERADRALGSTLPVRLSDYIFPKPAFDEAERRAAESALTDTRVAQPALAAADLAMCRWLTELGIHADMACGHSFGELAALSAAGAIGFDDLIRLSEARGRAIVDGRRGELGTMAAIDGAEEAVWSAVAGIDGLYLANVNTPSQTVLAGTHRGIEEALARLSGLGIAGRRLPVAAAFHSPLIEGAQPIFADALRRFELRPPRFPVYSNTTAAPHADDPDRIKTGLVEHLLRPVRFAEEIRAMHAAGARVFVEAGPGKVLTGLISQTLAGEEFTAVAMDQAGRPGVVQVLHSLGQLASLGLRLHFQKLFEGRAGAPLDLTRLAQTQAPSRSATTWTIAAGRAVPPGGPAARPSLPVRRSDRRADPSPPMPPPVVTERVAVHANVAGAADTAALTHHHRLMAKFLETHRTVMLGYLGSTDGSTDGQGLGETEIAEPIAGAAPVVETVATASEPAVPTPTPAAGSAPPTEVDVVQRLVALVSERTGYPPEMLGLDLDLEADLGIDSIKRVEILSAMQSQGLLTARDADMDALSKLKTLRAIGKWAAGDSAGEPPPAPRAAEPVEDSPLTRLTLAVVDAPDAAAATPDSTGVVLITDAGGAVARRLSERLAAAGIRTATVSIGQQRAGAAYHLETTDVAAATAAADAVRRDCGPIAALVHTVPLRDPDDDGGDEAFFDRLRGEVGALFLLARSAENDLRSAGGSVIAATALGGMFSVDPASPGAWPGSGASAGFLKTLAREWPEVSCRAVDFDAATDPEVIAAALCSELATRDGLTEVGYQGKRRVTIALRPAPLRRAPQIALDRQSVILLTGGARGITADIARELAERFQPTLVLVGRSPLPEPEEAPEVARCADVRELRAMLVDRRGRDGMVAPAAIEAECRRLLQAREIRATLADLRNSGATVEYHAVDAADAAAFGGLLDDVRARLGRIDGVVHGAGILEDKLVRDKTPESFERVLRPKVGGALTLISKLRTDGLKFLVFFSSVSARFGNPGQCDYAAANETLNKLAAAVSRRWPARVVSINWGPWESSGGMVSPELARRFADAGVRLIPRARGRRAFVEEVLYGDRGDAEVVWGEGWPAGGASAEPAPPVEAAPAHVSSAVYPLVGELNGGRRAVDGPVEIELETGPAIDAYLNDHLLDGVPVMPAAVAMELMAEVAAAHTGGVCAGVSNLRVLQGITYPRGEPRRLRVALTGQADSKADPKSALESDGARVAVSIDSGGASRTVHYRARVIFRQHLEGSPTMEPLRLAGRRSLPISIDDAYEQWLFHGPRFAGVTSVDALGDNGIVGRIRVSTPTVLLGRSAPGRWLLDPVMVDSGLQLLCLWSRACLDETPLPSRLRSCRRYAETFPAEIVCEAEIDRRPGGSTLVCDLRFVDDDRRLLVRLEGMEVTCSRSLNRLGVKTAGAGVR